MVKRWVSDQETWILTGGRIPADSSSGLSQIHVSKDEGFGLGQ